MSCVCVQAFDICYVTEGLPLSAGRKKKNSKVLFLEAMVFRK